MSEMELLLREVSSCRLCSFEHGNNPVLQASSQAKILIAGQAPGRKVHESGVPFDDASGERLRDWLGVNRDEFYDPTQVAILPMAFCFPGKKGSGDAPPPAKCAETWRDQLMSHLGEIELTIILGKYALDWHLGGNQYPNLTSTVQAWRSHPEGIVVLPHPSPRNNIWLKKNPWFGDEVIPHLKGLVNVALGRD